MKQGWLLPMFLAGCVSYAPASWDADFRALDGKTLQISGTPIFGGLDESLLYLCPLGHTGYPTGRCLDVVGPATLMAKLRNAAVQCIGLSGKFNAFGPDRVGLGNFRSDVGYIEVVRSAPCNGR